MGEPNPFHLVQEIAGGYCLSRCLHVVADLGVADVLDETPQTAVELAEQVKAHPDALGRVLRLLAAYGVFETHGNTFAHSPASRLLQTNHPQSMRSFARMFGLEVNWTAYGKFEHSVRTGRPATEQTLPDGLWAYYAQHPEANSIFNGAMTAKAHSQIAGIMHTYDFLSFKQIGDIGGGHGHLLQAILAASPTTEGVLFDLPHVIAEVSELASQRLRLQAGDFFTDQLPECDAYVLMEIIHDWDDEASLSILEAIRRVAPAHAKLLVIETIIPPYPGPGWSTMLDVAMLALLGGRQRTQQEYATLLTQVGFRLKREMDTHAGISILEATPV